jgi:hypothetical protein
MTEIAKFLQFNISFKLVDDGMVTIGHTKTIERVVIKD